MQSSTPGLDRVSSASARARASASAPLRAMIYRILKRVPGGEQTKVFVGVCLVLGIGMAPVAYKKTKRGHDYFSSEKPEEVEQGMAEKEKAKYEAIVAKNTSKP